MKYQPPFDPALLDPVDGIHNDDPDAPYVNGDPRTGREGSIPPAATFEHPLRELVHLIDYSGQDPSHLDLEQVRKAIKWMIDFLLTIGKSGDGVDLYHGNEDGVYLLRSLVAGANTTLTVVTHPTTGRTSIRIDTVGAGGGVSGESNTASNVGDAGVAVFKQKSGVDLEFRKIYGTNGAIVTQDGDKIKVEAPGISPTLAAVAPALFIEERRQASDTVRSLVLGQWTRRPINTVIVNQIPGASLAAEQITLPAGTYRAQFAGAGWRTGLHVTRIFSLTGSIVLGLGIACDAWTGSGNGTANVSSGVCRFTLAAPTTIELQAYSGGDTAGRMGNADQSFESVNGWVEIVKEA